MNQTQEDEIIAKLEALTRQGRKQPVLAAIDQILKQDPSRSLLPRLARLVSRNHAYLRALQILHPVVRDDRDQVSEASSEHLLVYAKSLLSIGALEEASECLERIKEVSAESLLTEAFVHFGKWDYQKALPILKRYCQLENLSEYQVLIGKINLLAATIAVGSFKDALSLSDHLLEILSQRSDYQLLYGNCLELRSQVFICQGFYDEALVTLPQAETALREQPGRYLLYVNKWTAIAKLGISIGDQEAQKVLANVRQEALQFKVWETVRDCDFHLARLTKDPNLLQRILLGTPYKGFHDRNRKIFNIPLNSSKDLEYCPNEHLAIPQTIGLDEKSISDYSFLSSTSWPLLQIVTRDIYRPPRISSVFSELYKGQYFDPFTSPQRVRNAVHRFNIWARDANSPLKIIISTGEFHLSGPTGVGIRRIRQRNLKQDWQAAFQIFKSTNESRSFNCQDVAKFFDVTAPTALKLIRKAIQSGKIRKLNHGKNSRYLFSAGRKAV